jgi:hypothetical protein
MDDAKKDFGQLRQGEKATVSAKLSRCLGGVWVHVSFWDMVDGELASQPPPEFGRGPVRGGSQLTPACCCPRAAAPSATAVGPAVIGIG